MYRLDEREVSAVRRVLLSRKLFRYEPGGARACERFERSFAREIGVSRTLLVTSGTGALIAALGACGVGPGDEVLVPAYTFVATPLAAAAVGAVPVVVNVDSSLGLDPVDMERKLSRRTRAVIAVHMDGLSCDMRAILRIARKKRLRVVEDAAQALGGSYRGRRLGSLGDMGCFSFNQDKVLTCGEGGAVATSDPALFERAVCMHDGASLFTTRSWGLSPERAFLGGAMRVSELSGALLGIQLGRFRQILAGLRARKRLWTTHLAGAGTWRVLQGHDQAGDCGTSVHLMFDSPRTAGRALSVIEDCGAQAQALSARPGHCAWQWMGYFTGGRAVHDSRLDPYRFSARRPSFDPADCLETLLIVGRTVKISVDLGLPLGRTRALARRVRDRLGRL